MNTQQLKLSPEESKRHAWQLRQKDTGWGRAIAQAYIPFYGIYYAFSRRTITPTLYAYGLTFLAAFSVGILNSKATDKQLEAIGTLTGLIVAPAGYRLGTNHAREFAKQKLDGEA
jgi:hypothetical protein